MTTTMQPEETGKRLLVSQNQDANRRTLELRLKTNAECVLHWGVNRQPGAPWRRPPESCWPRGTVAADGAALRSPFVDVGNGDKAVTFQFDEPFPERNLACLVFFPRENRWLRDGNGDFAVAIPRPPGGGPSLNEIFDAWAAQTGSRQLWDLDGGDRLAANVEVAEDKVRVRLACDADTPLVLHWAFKGKAPGEWLLPPDGDRPAGTTGFDEHAVQTPFKPRAGLQALELEFHKPTDGSGPRGLKFVLFRPEDNGWIKSRGKDMELPLFKGKTDPRVGSAKLQALTEEIIEEEMGASSWSLMHRFNLCYDLLEGVQEDPDGLALLYAWLRYSATRHLDWQRSFNTKPRELSHAQDRLTARLAGVWKRHQPGTPGAVPECRGWVRLMFATLGRGGDGQRVRDEILEIMHREHIKEVRGRFMEEWHQKLHNNTTPDDVVICEAFLAFLKSNGNRDLFYQTLEQGGVTRERLASFERPIKTEPEFWQDKKDALIRDFENFLRVLKSVHSGTDLESAAGAARSHLGDRLKKQMDALLAIGNKKPAVGELAEMVTTTREELGHALADNRDDAALRDLLFLDLALEDFLRRAIEQQPLSQFDRDALVELIHWTLRNLTCSLDTPELDLCGRHWEKLKSLPRAGKDWALHAKSIADRAGRWLQTTSDDVYQLLQPKAEVLGTGFGVAKWVVDLFSEEVVRGGPAFALSLLLRRLDPLLRQEAGLGGWQVISPAAAFGRVRLTDKLIAIQGERFTEPTVIIADTVGGNEEIPASVTAVLTADAPDLVSHVSVRARNAHILFATCFDREEYERLKKLTDRTLALSVTPGGDVKYVEASAPPHTGAPTRAEPSNLSMRQVNRMGERWVVTPDQFKPEFVGGKSSNLNGLRGRLADWIRFPISLALPFGVFERTLADASNREIRGKYEALLTTIEQNRTAVLTQVRALLLGLTPPRPLQDSLMTTWQQSGLPPVPWEQAWKGIQRVWASKWNERAYLSRRARNIPHDELLMAVLIQQVVPADYAYVIHTVNPLTGNTGELYAEVVLGLGETLVGNYPGRAMGFICHKQDLSLELVSYPGKNLGLYGKGVIFRSDSNGEDLERFAGAGLYDSYLAEEPTAKALDYTNEKLVWDVKFRDELLRSIARIGLEVEKVLGSAQDVEGAVAGGQFYAVQTRAQVGLEGL